MKKYTLGYPLAFLFLLCLNLAVPGDLAAATCDRSGCGRASCATPAAPAPSDRWGGLRPVSTYATCGQFGPAFCTDSSAFLEQQQAYSSFPWFMSLDTENQYLFIALSHGLQVWDAHSALPQPLSQLSFRAFPVWSSNPEIKWPLQDVDAPANVDDEVAVAGTSGIGIAIIDLADKSSPKLLYQSYKKEGNQVYAATLGARRYAFLAAPGGEPSGGLFAYDMTQAKLYNGCFEAVPAGGEAVNCPGVYLGRIGAKTPSFVDGVDQFVVAGAGSSRGFEIWNLANPASPQLALSGLNDRTVNGVALWKQAGAYYLAARTSAFEPAAGREVHRLSIYNVSCIAGSCSGLGAPLSNGEYNGQGTEYLDFSRSDGTPFLYLGTDSRCSNDTQHEWLLDVSNPAAPQDISPFNYWGWYYRSGPTGFNLVAPRGGKFVGGIFYRAALSLFDSHQRTGLTGGGGSAIDVAGPDSGQVGTLYQFTATATGCTPNPNGWTWSVADGAIAGAATGPQIAVSWSNPGNKPVSATNSACGSALGLKGVSISGTGALAASFNYSPSSAQPGQVITFDASSSSGGPTQYTWDFGDGTTAVGKIVTHSFAAAGGYNVLLTVSRSGSTAQANRVVAVSSIAPPPVDGTFQTSAPCENQFGFTQCQANAGAAVSLTANATGNVTYAWDFGDGATASGRSVTHTWAQAGSYAVTLTVSNGQTSSSSNKTFLIGSTGPGPGPDPDPGPAPGVLLPWIAETSGALVQTTDLYVYNPGALPVTVVIEFRKRGLTEAAPPRATRTIAPGATLFLAGVLKELFGRENVSGFLSITPQGAVAVAPVVASFNATTQGGSRFGQTVPGLTLGGSVPAVQTLVGLTGDAERLSYFGVSNPTAAPATYRVRFFNAAGAQIAVTPVLTLAPFGQRQFQEVEIRGTYGVSGRDYRVQVETVTGGPLYPYASVIRLATLDPSFLEAAVTKTSRAYLVGALSAPGPFGSLFRTDVVLANPGAQALHADLSFSSVGALAQPTAPVSLTLQPGETRRLADVINGQWHITNAIGILTLVSREPSGALPIFQGESYNNAQPARRFGQSMAALGDPDAAAAGHQVILTGLRQDTAYRTTLWLFNPSASEGGLYDLIYRALDGTVLGRLDGIALAPGKARQLSPNQHPIPAAGVTGGFTVEALVRSGRLLAAGQVVNNATNDPAYVQGAAR